MTTYQGSLSRECLSPTVLMVLDTKLVFKKTGSSTNILDLEMEIK